MKSITVTVLFGAEQRGEARAGVETRPAEPVDGTFTGNQCGRVAVADEGIVFDECGHR
jgi:hypothetical protein